MTEAAPAFPVTLDALEGLARRVSLLTHDPATDLVSAKLHEGHCWEPFESALWLACIGPGTIAVDVGANLGYFSVVAALHPGLDRAFAFEPASDNFALLCDNLLRNGCAAKVLPIQAALGAEAGGGVLHRSADNLGDHQIYGGDGERERESIRLLRGADWLDEYCGHIDLLKIDTQGSETDVLRGLLPMLRRSRAGLRILVELTPFSLRLAGSSGRELIELLADLGLPLAIVDHVEGRLVPSDAESLSQWCDNVAAVAGDRGFMNIFAGPPPAGF